MLITQSKSRFNSSVNISRAETKDEHLVDFRFHLRMPPRHATATSTRSFSALSTRVQFSETFSTRTRNDFPNNTVSGTTDTKRRDFASTLDQNKRIKLLVSKSKAINKPRCFFTRTAFIRPESFIPKSYFVYWRWPVSCVRFVDFAGGFGTLFM
jgi:hypothetical protein